MTQLRYTRNQYLGFPLISSKNFHTEISNMGSRKRRLRACVQSLNADALGAITFTINRNQTSQEITGFTLTGCGESNAERFCSSLRLAHKRRQVLFQFHHGHFLIINGYLNRYYVVKLDEDDEVDLSSLIRRKGLYQRQSLHFLPIRCWGSGCTISRMNT